MKDYDVLNEVWEQEVWEDFDTFLAAEKWNECVAIIEMMGDKGFEGSAIRMNHVLNQAKAAGYLFPVSQENIPVLRPEETDLDVVGVFSEGRYEDQYDKN